MLVAAEVFLAVACAEGESDDVFHVGGAVELPQVDHELFLGVDLECVRHVWGAYELACEPDGDVGFLGLLARLAEQFLHENGVGRLVGGGSMALGGDEDDGEDGKEESE